MDQGGMPNQEPLFQSAAAVSFLNPQPPPLRTCRDSKPCRYAEVAIFHSIFSYLKTATVDLLARKIIPES